MHACRHGHTQLGLCVVVNPPSVCAHPTCWRYSPQLGAAVGVAFLLVAFRCRQCPAVGRCVGRSFRPMQLTPQAQPALSYLVWCCCHHLEGAAACLSQATSPAAVFLAAPASEPCALGGGQAHSHQQHTWHGRLPGVGRFAAPHQKGSLCGFRSVSLCVCV